MKFLRLSRLLTAACLALMAGCAGVQPHTSISQAAVSSDAPAAFSLLPLGHAQQAANVLENQAKNAQDPTLRSSLNVDAALAWLIAGDSAKARIIRLNLNTPSIQHFSAAQTSRLHLLDALLALEDRTVDAADQQLGQTLPQGLNSALAPYWYIARAQVLEQQKDIFAALTNRSLAQTNLGVLNWKNTNQTAIQRLVQSIATPELLQDITRIQHDNPLYPVLAHELLARGQSIPSAGNTTGQNVGFVSAMNAREPIEPDGYSPPTHIAVLLPLTGKLAAAAMPVRDGLLASYYAHGQQRPNIVFFDTMSTPEGALSAYAHAVDAGVQMVIGPLSREEVAAVFANKSLPVPVFGLNQPGNGQLPPAGQMDFSLAPEDEGIAAADYLIKQQRLKVFVIANQDDANQRAARAFVQRIQQAQGEVVNQISVPDIPGNITKQLMLGRAADGVFLALRATTARALMQQLSQTDLYHQPRITTSLFTQGTGRQDADRVLDGIIFPSIEWDGSTVSGLPSSAEISQQLPSARGPGRRLFAFGYDAWLATAYPNALLGRDGHNGLQGATGILRIDASGQIQRTPNWNTFRDGLTVPLQEP